MADELIKPPQRADRSGPRRPVDRPARSPRAQARSAELLAAALAMIAGFIDAYGMITYGVYVSFMSGNTTQTGYQAAEGAFGPASLSALAILFFVVGSFAGTLLVQAAGAMRDGSCLAWSRPRWRRSSASRSSASLSGGVAHRDDQFRDGNHEQRALPRRRAIGEPHFRDRNLSRVGSHLALALRRAPLRGRAGTVGHPSAPGAAPGARSGLGFLVGASCRERRRRATAPWFWRRRR